MVIEVIFVVMCLLVSQAKGLECITCASASGPCSGDSQQCPAHLESCASIDVLTFVGRSFAEVNVKSCFPSAQCLNGSLNTGISDSILSTSCCNTDNCNTGSPPAAGVGFGSGRQCFTCELSSTLTGCSTRIRCSSDEDRCLSATVNLGGQSSTVKGCATQSVCSGAFSEILDSVAAEVTCCEGDLCNSNGVASSACSATHSVLFLLWPLGSVLLFH